MIEIILLAGAISIDLEPYTVENTEADTPGVGANTAVDGGAFQWTNRRSGPDNSLYQDNNDSASDSVIRDAFGRPVGVEE